MGISAVLAVLLQLVALLIAVVGGFWAYVRFVVEKGLLPPTNFSINALSLETLGGYTPVQLTLTLKNLGSSTLIVSNVRVKVRYLIDTSDGVGVLDGNSEKAGFGQVCFPHSLHQEALESVASPTIAHSQPCSRKKASGSRSEGFKVIDGSTFVMPGVTQDYTFIARVPAASALLLAKGSFTYDTNPSRLQRWVLRVAKAFGLIQFSLDSVSRPHTVQGMFRVAPKA